MYLHMSKVFAYLIKVREDWLWSIESWVLGWALAASSLWKSLRMPLTFGNLDIRAYSRKKILLREILMAIVITIHLWVYVISYIYTYLPNILGGKTRLSSAGRPIYLVYYYAIFMQMTWHEKWTRKLVFLYMFQFQQEPPKMDMDFFEYSSDYRLLRNFCTFKKSWTWRN